MERQFLGGFCGPWRALSVSIFLFSGTVEQDRWKFSNLALKTLFVVF
jgi:hypothetical protein